MEDLVISKSVIKNTITEIKNNCFFDIEDTEEMYKKTLNILESERITKEILIDLICKARGLKARKVGLSRDTYKLDFCIKNCGNKPINKNFKSRVDEIMSLNGRYTREDYKNYKIDDIYIVSDKAGKFLSLMIKKLEFLIN